MKIGDIYDVGKIEKIIENTEWWNSRTLAQAISNLDVDEKKLKELGWNNDKVVEGEEAERAMEHAGWIRKNELTLDEGKLLEIIKSVPVALNLDTTLKSEGKIKEIDFDWHNANLTQALKSKAGELITKEKE